MGAVLGLLCAAAVLAMAVIGLSDGPLWMTYVGWGLVFALLLAILGTVSQVLYRLNAMVEEDVAAVAPKDAVTVEDRTEQHEDSQNSWRN